VFVVNYDIVCNGISLMLQPVGRQVTERQRKKEVKYKVNLLFRLQ